MKKTTIAQKGSFTDSRDGKIYKTIKIGNQTWMAENLNYDAEGSKFYNNDFANCEKYGRLYDWETAVKACPAGWHLPSSNEFDELVNYVNGTIGTNGCYENAKHLKATNGWNDNDGITGNGNDTYSFTALPGGDYYDGRFFDVGNEGCWWSATESNGNCNYAILLIIIYNSDEVGWNSCDKSYGLSVRCIKD